MDKTQEARLLTHEIIARYSCFLQENEKSSATILKYIHDLNLAAAYFNENELTKAALMDHCS